MTKQVQIGFPLASTFNLVDPPRYILLRPFFLPRDTLHRHYLDHGNFGALKKSTGGSKAERLDARIIPNSLIYMPSYDCHPEDKSPADLGYAGYSDGAAHALAFAAPAGSFADASAPVVLISCCIYQPQEHRGYVGLELATVCDPKLGATPNLWCLLNKMLAADHAHHSAPTASNPAALVVLDQDYAYWIEQTGYGDSHELNFTLHYHASRRAAHIVSAGKLTGDDSPQKLAAQIANREIALISDRPLDFPDHPEIHSLTLAFTIVPCARLDLDRMPQTRPALVIAGKDDLPLLAGKLGIGGYPFGRPARRYRLAVLVALIVGLAVAALVWWFCFELATL